MNANEQEPTQEEMDAMHAQWQKEAEEEERWLIDAHNGEHEHDPPCCFEDMSDYHAQFLSPSQRREQGYSKPAEVIQVVPTLLEDDELPF